MTVPVSSLEGEHVPDPIESVPDAGAGAVAGKSPTRLALARFRRDRLSMIAFWIVVAYLVLSIAAPFLVKLGVLDPYSTSTEGLDVNLGSIPTGAFGGISASHPLGIEPGTGRDVLSRVVLGMTLSLSIALLATLLAVVLGAVIGIVSGFSGGVVDAVLGRLTDLTLSFPQTLMLIALATTGIELMHTFFHLPTGPVSQGAYVVLVLALFGWTSIARVIRGQVLSLREREFIEAARLFGASRRRIYFKEILPNLWAPLLIYFTLTMPAFVSAEAALSYLGVGIKPPTPTLGNILNDSVQYASADFTFFFTPAFLIALIVISFNLLGDGLRDALDPKGSR